MRRTCPLLVVAFAVLGGFAGPAADNRGGWQESDVSQSRQDTVGVPRIFVRVSEKFRGPSLHAAWYFPF